MKRKLFTFVLALVISAGSLFASNTSVGGIWYDFDTKTKTATVTYKGSNCGSYLDEYTGSVVIPDSVTYQNETYSVTSIKQQAFQACANMTSVVIPNSVTSIGLQAFGNCTGLISITIGSGVTSFGNYAFMGCTSLTAVYISDLAAWCSISAGSTPFPYAHNLYLNGELVTNLVIPNSVTRIGNSAFYNCTGLTSVTIPNSVTSIGSSAFFGCTGLTSVTIPNSVTTIGYRAFVNCSGLISVTLNSNEFVSQDCESNSSGLMIDVFGKQVETYIIGEGVLKIGYKTFQHSSGMTSITIPNSVTRIGSSAFSGCSSLTSITIPNSVTSIGTSAFSGCGSLTSVTCFATTPPTLYSGTFNNVVCSKIPLHVPEQSIPVYQSHSAWNKFRLMTSIGKYIITFLNWDGTEILFSEVAKGSLPQYPGATPTREATTELTYTFAGWTPELVAATKDASYTATYTSSPRLYNITWQQDDGTLIDETPVEYGQVPTHADPIKESVGYTYTFMGWSPQIVAVTGDATYRATYSSTRKSYTITWLNEDGSLIDKTTVGYGMVPTHANPTKAATAEFTYTFAGWTPQVVAVAGDATYTATFSSIVNKYNITATAVNGSVNGTGTYPYGSQVKLTAVPDYGYHFTKWFDGNTDNPRTVVLTQDMTFTAEFAIDKSGTCGKDNLLKWSFANDGTLTISGNGELTENYTYGVEAPNQMQTLIIEKGVTAIGAQAFKGKTTLQKMVIGSNVTAIGNYAFADINNRQLTSLVMPAELRTIGDYAFSGNTYVESIDFNAKLQSIGAYAFKDCYRVSEMKCLAVVTPDVGTNALSSINENATLCVPAECLKKYKVDSNWGRFDLCELGSTTTTTDTKVVTVEPSDNTALFIWPTENNAGAYTLKISKDGVIFCTLIFDGNGQLTGIAFAPSRDEAAHAPAATTSVAGMSFTVTGLNSASKYAYHLTVADENDKKIQAYSGEFATTGYQGAVNPGGQPEVTPQGIDQTTIEKTPTVTKFIRDGQLFIQRDGKTYSVTGQEVE